MKKHNTEKGLVEKILKIRDKLNDLYMSNPKEYFKRLEDRKKQILSSKRANQR